MIRRITQVTAVLGLGVTAAVLAAARQAPAQQVFAAADSARPASTSASAAGPTSGALREPVGIRAHNVDLWSGNVRGDVTGRATVVLENLGLPATAFEPLWPIQTRWTVESVQDGRSFVAELFGTIDSRNDCMHLGGTITDGWKKGAEVQVNCLSSRKGGKVALRILPLYGER